MRHCPLTVEGAKTAITDVEGGVELAVTAETEPSVAEIRRRVHHLEDLTSDKPTDVPHGGGSGGGGMRNCPVVSKGTRVTGTDVPSGVRIKVEPRDPGGVGQLREETRKRMAALPQPGGEVMDEVGADAKDTRLFTGAIANLDGKGARMLVVGGFVDDGAGRVSYVSVYEQHARAWKRKWQSTWKGGAQSMLRNLRVADLDGDGKQEIVVNGRVGADAHAADGQVKVLSLGNDELVVRAELRWQTGVYTHGYGLDVADLDGDGRPEIVTGGFFFDGAREHGELRVLRLAGSDLKLVSRTQFDDQAFPSARVNGLATGDLDGDGRPEIVTTGRNGEVKSIHHTDPPDRREQGDITAWSLRGDALVQRGRYAWRKGSTLRLRAAALADLDADGKSEVIAAGQYDAAGKPCLGLLRLGSSGMTLDFEADWGTAEEQGEIKDVVVFGKGAAQRVATAGPLGPRASRQGEVQIWRYDSGRLLLERTALGVHGKETRARALVVWPGEHGDELFTVGHALHDTGTVGQLLDWGPVR